MEVTSFYNSIEKYRKEQGALLEQDVESAIHCANGIMPDRRTDFSWLLGIIADAPHLRQVTRQAQESVKKLLLKGVDFGPLASVFDFGCGTANDLIELGSAYPHLSLKGYTISSEEKHIADSLIEKKGLSKKIEIFERDSTAHPFPGNFDLIMGVGVIHHIEDKEKIFAQVFEHLNEDGIFLLTIYVLNERLGISKNFEEHSAYLPDLKYLENLVNDSGFLILRSLDLSQEKANFLYDASFESNLRKLGADSRMESYLRDWHELGKQLDSGFIRYLQFAFTKKGNFSSPDSNKRWLEQPLSYSEIMSS